MAKYKLVVTDVSEVILPLSSGCPLVRCMVVNRKDKLVTFSYTDAFVLRSSEICTNLSVSRVSIPQICDF